MKKILLASVFAAAQIATWPVTAQAAEPAEASESTSHEFDEIVVTAERRRTDLQKTPIAATVMTGADIANAGVTVVDQLQFVSPSAVVPCAPAWGASSCGVSSLAASCRGASLTVAS